MHHSGFPSFQSPCMTAQPVRLRIGTFRSLSHFPAGTANSHYQHCTLHWHILIRIILISCESGWRHASIGDVVQEKCLIMSHVTCSLPRALRSHRVFIPLQICKPIRPLVCDICPRRCGSSCGSLVDTCHTTTC